MKSLQKSHVCLFAWLFTLLSAYFLIHSLACMHDYMHPLPPPPPPSSLLIAGTCGGILVGLNNSFEFQKKVK